MISPRQTRERLFKLYSVNLSYHDPSIQDSFVCPLCMRIFPSNLIDRLSIEHIIPKSLSGNITVLTCKQCNNTFGTLLESHVVKRIYAEDALSGKGKYLRGKLKTESGEVTANIYHSVEKGCEITFLPELSNPTSYGKVLEETKKGRCKGKLSINLGYNDVRSNVSYLRAAYLLMFRTFGYAYIKYFDISAPIRSLIFQPNASHVLNSVFRMPSFTQKINSVCILTHPEEYASFFAVLNYSTTTERMIGVAFPGFGKDARLKYNALISHNNVGREFKGQWKIIPYEHDNIVDISRKEMPKIISHHLIFPLQVEMPCPSQK